MGACIRDCCTICLLVVRIHHAPCSQSHSCTQFCVAIYLYKPAPVNRACRVNADGQSATCDCAMHAPNHPIPLVVCQFAVCPACSEQCCELPFVPVCLTLLDDRCNSRNTCLGIATASKSLTDMQSSTSRKRLVFAALCWLDAVDSSLQKQSSLVSWIHQTCKRLNCDGTVMHATASDHRPAHA